MSVAVEVLLDFWDSEDGGSELRRVTNCTRRHIAEDLDLRNTSYRISFVEYLRTFTNCRDVS
jgi:hypothetical protein